jgi:hypothetical protein
MIDAALDGLEWNEDPQATRRRDGYGHCCRAMAEEAHVQGIGPSTQASQGEFAIRGGVCALTSNRASDGGIVHWPQIEIHDDAANATGGECGIRIDHRSDAMLLLDARSCERTQQSPMAAAKSESPD